MNPSLRISVACMAMVLLIAGCEDRKAATAPAVAPVAPAASGTASSVAASTPVADGWAGKWTGPEGTFLQITGSNGKYQVTIQNLDGPRTFSGQAVSNQLAFERDGVKESIRATNGADTGMKWLSDKTHCLTVRAGEGYCKD